MKIGYRSIGEQELLFLLKSENPVYGQNRWYYIKGSGCPNLPYGTVCFFEEPYKWHDKNHLIDIAVNLTEKNISSGTATYMAAATFAETKIFTGRAGKTEYQIKEAYTRCYSPEDIISINLNGRYTSRFVQNVIEPFCKKYNIELYR